MTHSQIEASREEQRKVSGGDERKVMESQTGGSGIRSPLATLCLRAPLGPQRGPVLKCPGARCTVPHRSPSDGEATPVRLRILFTIVIIDTFVLIGTHKST